MSSGVTLRPLAELREHPDNPRRITREALDRLKRNLASDPGMLQARPLIALPDGTVIAGNMRLKAARELGWNEISVYTADLDETTARLWMLRDNNAFGEWDDTTLAAMIAELEQAGADTALTGFTTRELDELLHRRHAAEDDAPEPPAKPKSKPGRLYKLGPHRLVCGDATDPETIAKATESYTVHLVVTDPPYGVDYADKNRWLNEHDRGYRGERPIAGDDLRGDPLTTMLERALNNALDPAVEGAPIYVFHSESTGIEFRQAFTAAGWHHAQTLIWEKNHLVLGRQDYQWKHEPILYGWKPGAAHRWYGDQATVTVLHERPDLRHMPKADLVTLVEQLEQRQPGSIIREDREHHADLRPTMKPVRLLERLIRNSSARGNLVLDPFAGSGSTLIAADKLGRRAALIELDPAYCDVIRQRWAAWEARDQ